MFSKVFCNKSFGLLILSFFVSIPVFLLSGNRAEAASFNHVHTSACYKTEDITCTAHTYIPDSKTNTYHCPDCGRQTTFYETVYGDHCMNNYEPDHAYAYKQVCSVCGYVRCNDDLWMPPHHHRVTTLVCGMTESSPVAEVNLTVSTPGFSNTGVTLDAGVVTLGPDFSLASEPYDFGQGYTSNPTFEVTENGTYTVSVKDSTGRVVSTTVTVNTIDKDLPTIASISKDTEDWSEAGVVITVDASDAGSGLSDAAYSFNGSDYSDSNSFRVTSNGDVVVRVKDKAGNVAEQVITISNCGRDPVIVAREAEEARQRALEAERMEKEKEAAKKAELERIAAEKAAAEKAAKEKAAKEKALKNKQSKEAKVKDVSDNTGEVSGNDVSASDVSGGEVSGNDASSNDTSGNDMITVNDYSGKDKGPDNTGLYPKEEVTAEELMAEASKNGYTKASVGTLPLIIGIALILGGLIFVSFFNYIYISESGRRKIIVLCKIEKTDKRVMVKIKKGVLPVHGRYLIYFSPWNRIGLGKKDVYVKIEGNRDLIATDEREAFTY